MSRILIVGRTRMNRGNVCLGGHDIDRNFRAVRLFNRYGKHWSIDSPFRVGDLWDMRYRPVPRLTPPHVEDVRVEEFRKLQSVERPDVLVQARVRPWTGQPAAVFGGTVRFTQSGTAYIPASGPLPECSTGYWVPDISLERVVYGEKVRFHTVGQTAVRRFSWVGMQDAPPRIEAGSLVRVSLSRLFVADTAPEGYYVQVSGVLRHGVAATNGDPALEALQLPTESLVQKLVGWLRSG